MKLLLLTLATLVSADIKWTVTSPDNITCIVFDASTITASLQIDDGKNKTESISFGINETLHVRGQCNSQYNKQPADQLVVEFFPNGIFPNSSTDAQPWRLGFWFASVGEAAAFKLIDYFVETAPSAQFNSTTENFTKSATAELDVEAQSTNAFKCSTTGLALSHESTLEIKGLRVIARARLTTPDFPKEQVFEQCVLDTRTSDIVPIVVGACLAGLVVVVLVAYLIGRARAKRQGYASV